MEINIVGNRIIVKGNVKSIQDYEDIRGSIEQIIGNRVTNSIVIEFVDSFSLTSSVIGYLSKLVHNDNIKVNLRVCDNGLYSLLEDLGLIKDFNVIKICN